MASQKNPSLLQEEVDKMTEKELMTMLIDNYINLQRIKMAPDRDQELDRQITAVKAKLEALGIVTEDLSIN